MQWLENILEWLINIGLRIKFFEYMDKEEIAYINSEGYAKPVKLLDFVSDKKYTTPGNFPSEYYSEIDYCVTMELLLENGNKIRYIKEFGANYITTVRRVEVLNL